MLIIDINTFEIYTTLQLTYYNRETEKLPKKQSTTYDILS